MKKIFTGNNNGIKRKISGIMAGVMVLSTIGTVTYLKEQKVEAKETLYSIEKIISDLNESKESFNILEIVPDDVSGNIIIGDVSGNDPDGVSIKISQKMGFMGYYVGGSEPVRSDVDHIVNDEHEVTYNGTQAPVITSLNSSSLRYGAVGYVYDYIKDSAVYDEDDGPFSLENGYKEVRQGEYLNDGIEPYEVTDAMLEEWELDGTYSMLDRPLQTYVDSARGYMEQMGAGDGSAHYVLEYYYDSSSAASTASVSDNKTDIANELMLMYQGYCAENQISSNNIIFDDNDYFTINGGDQSTAANPRGYGSFDPYLVSDASSDADIYAVFGDIYNGDTPNNTISSGYRVDSAKRIYADSDYADGTPVYIKDAQSGRYKYYKDFGEVKKELNGGQAKLSDESAGYVISVVPVENVKALASMEIKAEKDILKDGSREIEININDSSSKGSATDKSLSDIDSENEDSIEGSLSDSDLGDGDDGVSGNETDPEIADPEDGDEGEGEGQTTNGDNEYYVVTFKYYDNYESSSVGNDADHFYGVNTFRYTDKAGGAQYRIPYSEKILVPNLMGAGTVGVKEACPADYLVYQYYSKSSLCNFRWTGDETSENEFNIRGAEIYYSYGIENKEWFKRYVFDRDCYPYDNIDEDKDNASKLPVKVYRKTAQEVEEADITGKGDVKYNMIVLMAGSAEFCIGDEDDYLKYCAGNKDIDPAVYIQILDQVSDADSLMPIIVDYNIIADELTLPEESQDSLAYNLAYALTMDDVSGYSAKLYGQTRNIRSGQLAGTVFSPISYVSDNSITILSYNNGDFVNKNIYVYRRCHDNIVGFPINVLNKTFNKEFDNNTTVNGFSEVELDIANEKAYRAADFSLKDRPLTNDKVTEATVIRYIIGYGMKRVTEGKGEVNVLEIEPVACFDLAVNNVDITDQYTVGSDEYNKLVLEKEVVEVEDGTGKLVTRVTKNIYEGELYYKERETDLTSRTIIKQKGLKINLTQMTSSELVGHIEDLNSTYDLIYIGTNTGLGRNVKQVKVVDTPAGTKWVKKGDLIEEIRNSTRRKDDYAENGYIYSFIRRISSGNYVWGKYEQVDARQNERGAIRINVPEVFHYEDVVEENVQLYGGFHHRTSTQADVTAGRALNPNVTITDYNDDNMDGLVYCNVGDFAYLTEAAGGSLKVWTGQYDNDGNKIFKWPEYVGENRFDSNGNQDNTHLKGYGYINVDTSSDVGYSVKENGERDLDNYSVYRCRYSGNDISKDNMEALIDFVRAGYPIILADDFYSSYDEETRTGTINKCTIDTSSYMYECVTKINEENSDKNLFRQSYIPANLFNFYVLNVTKPTIKMTDETCKIAQYSTVYLSDKDKADAGHYNAYFRFKIDNKGSSSASATYNVGLFIDINADGKYSEKNEGIAFSSFRDYNTQNEVQAIGIDEETNMPIYALEPGHEYAAICKLSGSFVGCLPWRISVTQNGNPYRRSNVDGYYAIRNNDKRVRVLQIRDSGSYTWNMKSDFDSRNRFYQLVTDTAYMPFKIGGKNEGSEGPDSITVRDFENITTNKTADGYYKYLQENYDMIILGFVDVYHGPNATATEGIKKYIENGYSVLFTHDCTSFINAKNRTAKQPNGSDDTRPSTTCDTWGYEFNSIIRNLVGMDRYDVLFESTHENEKPYKPRSDRKIVLDFETQGFTYHILNQWGYHDTSHQLSDYGWLEQTAFRSKGANTGVNGLNKLQENLVGISLGPGQYPDCTNYVTSVNRGQVTQYPYVLKDQFPVATTHSQYYQLDLTADDDNDGESDIVVWYCISAMGKSDDRLRNYKVDTSKQNVYNISPNDVRNNYYIYNKGNITYSGVGHSQPTGEDEFKLFINTMIAAYRTGLHEPDLAIVDGYGYNASTARQLYVTYDDQIRKAIVGGQSSDLGTGVNQNSDIDNTVDMYFNADQVSLVQNASAIEHNLYARVFLADDSSTTTLKDFCGEDYLADADKNLKVKELDLTGRVFNKNGGDTPLEVISGRTNQVIDGVEINETFMNGSVKVNSGTTYKVEVPVTDDDLWGGKAQAYADVKQTKRIYVVVRDYATYKNSSGNIYKTTLTKWAVKHIDMSRVEVFDLD